MNKKKTFKIVAILITAIFIITIVGYISLRKPTQVYLQLVEIQIGEESFDLTNSESVVNLIGSICGIAKLSQQLGFDSDNLLDFKIDIKIKCRIDGFKLKVNNTFGEYITIQKPTWLSSSQKGDILELSIFDDIFGVGEVISLSLKIK